MEVGDLLVVHFAIKRLKQLTTCFLSALLLIRFGLKSLTGFISLVDGDIKHDDCFYNHFSKIWRYLNSLIFEPSNVCLACRNIMGFCSTKVELHHKKTVNQRSPPYMVTGFLDGAAQHGNCGVGIYLILDKEHLYKLWLGCGKGLNTF